MRTTALALTLLFSASAALAQQQPPPPPREESVVDAARRARNENRQQAQPKHVYTADDLPRLRLIPISIVGVVLPEEDEADAAAGREENPEAIWRARFAEARSQIADAERAIATTQRNFDDAGRRAAITMDWNFLTCPREGGVFAPGYTGAGELNSRCSDLNQAKDRLAQARADLASLEEEFRRAGLPPGWARE